MSFTANDSRKELNCPRDCVHHAEGCLLGYPFEQQAFLLRHDPSVRERIAEVESNEFRVFWTSALGRTSQQNAPPCYHNHSEALPDCRYSVCGHLPETVSKAKEAMRRYEQRMRDEYAQRLFVIDTTGLGDNMAVTLERIRSNAPECLVVSMDEEGLDGLLSQIREAIQGRLGSRARRVSIYSAQPEVRNHAWTQVLDGIDANLDYLATWDIVRPAHFASKRVLHYRTSDD